MDTRQLIDKISKATGSGRDETASMLAALSEVMAEASAKMDTVTIAGFGSFEPRKRMERIAVQPSTGKRLLIPPKLLLAFRPSSLLKQKVKETGTNPTER